METDKIYDIVERALLYDLRLMFTDDKRETYTKQEIFEILDKLALERSDIACQFISKSHC